MLVVSTLAPMLGFSLGHDFWVEFREFRVWP